jgi:soluble lytic murein transglycosylase
LGWHDQAIVTLARAGYWDDLSLRFPTPHQDRVLASARSESIDPAWVYAVMRQESIFRSDAKSPAGALGLMQIMPATGRRIAKDLQMSLPNNYVLLKPDTNIRYGTRYLRHTLDQLQKNPVLATAAYNAGPNRVRQWLPEEGTLDADLWAETVPFFETRKYIKKVMEYTTVYEQRLGQSNGTMLARMGRIQAGAGK